MITGKTFSIPLQGELKKLKNTDYTFWKDLLQWEKSPEYKKVFDKADKGRILDEQEMDWAFSDKLNTDYYAVKFKLPSKVNPEKLFKKIRTNFNLFLDQSISSLETNSDTRSIWESNDPTGAILTFDGNIWGFLNIDDAAVLTTQASSTHWIFTPVGTALDWEHPLAGHREFGLEKNTDDSYTFYTRGVDMLWDVEDLVIAEGMFNFFDSADKLWNGVMNNLVKAINTAGGEAVKTHNFRRLIDWKKDVKKEDK